MVRDPRGLLLQVAPPVDTEPDLAEIERRARVRRAGRIGSVAAAVVLVAVAVVGGGVALLERDTAAPVIDDPPEDAAPEGWPLMARYIEIRYDEDATYEWEVAAERWDGWTMVRAPSFNGDAVGEWGDASADGLALAREGDHRWARTRLSLDDALGVGAYELVEELAAGLRSERYLVEEHPDGERIWTPLEAFTEQPATADDVPSDELGAPDLPTVRAEVAERVDLDPDDLVAFSLERDDGVHVIWVRDAASGLPLLYQEAVGEPRETDEGATVDPLRITLRIEATDVRFDAQLPALDEVAPPED